MANKKGAKGGGKGGGKNGGGGKPQKPVKQQVGWLHDSILSAQADDGCGMTLFLAPVRVVTPSRSSCRRKNGWMPCGRCGNPYHSPSVWLC